MGDEDHLQDDEEKKAEQEREAAIAKERAKKKQQEKEVEDKKRAKERSEHLEKSVPKFDVASLGQMSTGEIKKLCEDYHDKVAALNSDIYDWEQKLKKQEYQIQELTFQVQYEGKFLMPTLNKINKTERELAKLEQRREGGHASDFRDNLKSSGKNKWALDDDEKKDTKPATEEKSKEKSPQPADEESAPAVEEVAAEEES